MLEAIFGFTFLTFALALATFLILAIITKGN